MQDHKRKYQPQVQSTHYFRPSYDTKKRFLSYWYQINAIRRLNPSSVLEIGIGNNFVSSYLRQRQFKLTTLDIDMGLDPDVTASITALPFTPNSFHVVACYEVLEHLPYPLFLKSLSEIYRISQEFVIFSVPDRSHVFSCSIRASLFGKHQLFISLPRLFPLKRPMVEKQHFWEIGIKDFTLKRVVDDVESTGLTILDTYRLVEHPSHRFFVLRK